MEVKVRFTDPACKFEIIKHGDLIDLRAAEDIELKAPQAGVRKKKTVEGKQESYRNVTFNSKLISLGVAMELPAGMKANVYPRSSTYKNFGILLANSVGQIDNSYNGNNDVWKFNAIAFRDTIIHKGDRIAQFEIVPSMFATAWQKIKWLFSNGVKFKIVPCLHNEDRGGIGSTGIK